MLMLFGENYSQFEFLKRHGKKCKTGNHHGIYFNFYSRKICEFLTEIYHTLFKNSKCLKIFMITGFKCK